MMKKTSGSVLAFGLCLLFPAMADAQLFPNLPIKRQRTTCDEEAPVYGMYRRQYYGYYPTCWRRFPPGWGCPTPEAPNWEVIQRDEPIRMPRDLEAPALGSSAMPEPGAAGDRVAPPELPSETTSPFEMPDLGGGGMDSPPPAGLPPSTEVNPGFNEGPRDTVPPLVTPASYRPEDDALGGRSSRKLMNVVTFGLFEKASQRRK